MGDLKRVLRKNHQKVERSSILMLLLSIEVEDQLTSVLFFGKVPTTVDGLLEAPFG